MQKIASPQDLTMELRQLLAYAGEERPSRIRLAADLRSLADRVAADDDDILEMPERMAREFIVELNAATQDSVVGTWKARDAGMARETAGWLELISQDTSTLEVRIESDYRGGYELKVFGFINAPRDINQPLDATLARAQVVGDASTVARALKGLPQLAGKAFEAALGRARTSKRVYESLAAVAADLKRNTAALLRDEGWRVETYMSHTNLGGKTAIYGTVGIYGLDPDDRAQVEMAKKVVKKAASAAGRKHRDYAKIAGNGRSYFSASELHIPLTITYMA